MDRADIEKLARYNSEVARGLVHTEAWSTQMRLLQMRFDDEERHQGLIMERNQVGAIIVQTPDELREGQRPEVVPKPDAPAETLDSGSSGR